jgi:hypothetical protein
VLEDDGVEDDEELGDEELSLVEPAPAEPLGEELELDGALDDEAPPLALSFFGASLELEDELDGAGALVVPEAELEDEPGVALGELVVPEPDMEPEPVVEPEPEGEVVEDEDAPLGDLPPAVSVLLQPAIIAPPNARETASASVETFMWPPWLGYGKEAARIGPRNLRTHLAAGDFHFRSGVVSALFGPAWSPLCWKSRCCAADFGSTCPCCGFAPSRFSAIEGVPAADDVVLEPAAADGADGAAEVVSALGDGVGVALRSQPAAKASDRAAINVRTLIRALQVG